MRRPENPEVMYLDFDGFFASVEQAARPSLRGRPVAVVPFSGAGDKGVIIACSKEAKLCGVSSIMKVSDAKKLCPELLTVVQSPDLYRRAHNALISEIESVLPIDAVKSIDELACRLEAQQMLDPLSLGQKIKSRISEGVGKHITCSIGFAANRQLAKMACKAGKRHIPNEYGNGNLLWHPKDMPRPLFDLNLSDIPGIGNNLKQRLYGAGIYEVTQLYELQPKHMRKLWGNVTGERLWYALHGYAIQTPPQQKSMYGHGRVLAPNLRSPSAAYEIARVLTVKATRRLREDRWNTSKFWLYIGTYGGQNYQSSIWLPAIRDDKASLDALSSLWKKAIVTLHPKVSIARVHVALLDLSRSDARQLDLLLMDDDERKKQERITGSIDTLNKRYGKTIISQGMWPSNKTDYIGGKISFTRIPRAGDFL